MRELQQQEPRLDRLPETDSVCDEQPRDAVAKHGERRLELVGQQADRRLSGSPKGSEWMQADERAIEFVEPATGTDDAGAMIAVNCSQAIEGRQQRLLAVAADLPQPQGGAVDRAGDTGNAPSPPTRDDPAAVRLRGSGIGRGIHAALDWQLRCRRRDAPLLTTDGEALRLRCQCFAHRSSARVVTLVEPTRTRGIAAAAHWSRRRGCRNCAPISSWQLAPRSSQRSSEQLRATPSHRRASHGARAATRSPGGVFHRWLPWASAHARARAGCGTRAGS